MFLSCLAALHQAGGDPIIEGELIFKDQLEVKVYLLLDLMLPARLTARQAAGRVTKSLLHNVNKLKGR
ncbi:MAG: hypothetical protein M3R36_06720 [Bacteroidota bacterium]|nr:hypothetical protein [Bacteroidota bacterium]